MIGTPRTREKYSVTFTLWSRTIRAKKPLSFTKLQHKFVKDHDSLSFISFLMSQKEISIALSKENLHSLFFTGKITFPPFQ